MTAVLQFTLELGWMEINIVLNCNDFQKCKELRQINGLIAISKSINSNINEFSRVHYIIRIKKTLHASPLV